MPMNRDLFWFPELAAHLDTLNPAVNVGDAQCRNLNLALTNLRFGASYQRDDRLGAALQVAGFPANALGNFANLEAWKKGELAQMRLHRLVREHLGNFDRAADTAAFTARIDTDLDNVSNFLINTQLPLVAGDGPRRKTCLFAAIVNAFSNDAMYGFTAVHKAAFLGALLANGKILQLIAEGISAADISNALIALLPFVRNAEQFQAIADFYAAAGPLNAEEANFKLQLKNHVPHLFDVGVVSADLAAQGVDLIALRLDILARLQPTANMMSPAEFAAVIRELYGNRQALHAQADELNQHLMSLVGRDPSIASIRNLQEYAAHLPDRTAFDNAVGAQAERLVRAAADDAGLQAVAGCLRASNKETELRDVLVKPWLVVAGVTAAQIVAAHGNNDAITAQMGPMIDATLALLAADRYAAFEKAVAVLTAAYGGAAAAGLLQAKLKNPDFITAALSAGLTIEEIAAECTVASGAAVDAAAIFQQFITELTPAAGVPGANITRIAEIQALIGNVPGRAFSQKAVFDAAVIAQANRLLTAATAVNFDETVRVLRACDGGQAAVNTYINNNANIASLIAKGITVADIVAATGAPAPLDAAAVCGFITAAVTAGTITTPADLLRAQTQIAEADPASVVAFRTALVDSAKIQALFDAITAAPAPRGNLDYILNLVHNGTNDSFKQAFFTKIKDHAIALLAAPKNLTINQIQELATGNAVYLVKNNKQFRELLIPQVTDALKAYLETLEYKPSDNTWSHKLPSAAAVTAATLAEIKTQLNTYRDRLQKFNNNSVAVTAYAAGRDDTNNHGLQALKDFLEKNASCYDKLHRVYGNPSNVNNEFAFANITPATQRTALIDDFKKRIDAASTGDELSNVINGVETVTVTALRSLTDYKQEIRNEIVLHLQDSATILKLINNGITPAQIDAACASLPGHPVTRVSLAVALHAVVRSYVGGSPVDINTFNDILVRVTAHPDDLGQQGLANYIEENFVILVANKAITAANLADVTTFTAGARAAGVAVAGDVTTELDRRRTLFVAKAKQPAVTAAQLKTELQQYVEAYQAIGQLDAFKNSFYGDLATPAQYANVPDFLAKGLSIDDLVAIFNPVNAAVFTGQLRDKAVAFINEKITALAADLAPTDQKKVENKATFQALSRIFFAIKDDTLQATLRDQIHANSVSLLRSGVDPKDLVAIDSRLSIDELERLVSVPGAITDPAQLAALQQSLRRDRAANVDPMALFRSLSPEKREEINKVVYEGQAVAVSDVYDIYKKALQELARLYPDVIGPQGLHTGDATLRAKIENEYLKIVTQEVENLQKAKEQRLSNQGIDVSSMTNLEEFQSAVKRLHDETRALQVKGATVSGAQALKATLASLQKKVNAISNAADISAMDYDALKAISEGLEKIQDTDINRLDAQVAQERAERINLQKTVSDRAAAIDLLIGTDAILSLFNAARDAIKQMAQGNPGILAALEQHLATPDKFCHQLKQGFKDLFELPLFTAQKQKEFTAHIEKARQSAVENISGNLVQQEIAQGTHRLPRVIDHNVDALRVQAEQLLVNRINLGQLGVSLEGAINDDSLKLAELKTQFTEFKAAVKTQFGLKGKRDTYASKVATSLETSRTYAAVEHPDFSNFDTVKGFFEADPAVGMMHPSAGNQKIVDVSAIGQQTLVAKLEGVRGEQGFCPIKITAVKDKVVGVQLAGTAYRVDAAAKTSKAVSSAPLLGSGKLKDNERVLALESGRVLADEMIGLSKAQSMNFFGASEKISITGNYFIKPGMSAAGKREVYFNIIAMGCAIRELESKGYRVNQDCQGYKDFSRARELYRDQVAYTTKEHPEFSARLDAINAPKLMKDADGRLKVGSAKEQVSAVEDANSDIAAVRRNLGMSGG